MAWAMENAGCAGLAVHPRTRAQGYAGSADWQVIAELKREVRRMPIIGNGDVKTPQDARRMREITGCDFVMIGRAALGNPWIFRQLAGGLAPTVDERCELVLHHFQQHLAFVGEELAAVRAFRKHLAWYAHGLRSAASFRADVNQIESAEHLRIAVRGFFSTADADSRANEEQVVDYRAALG
jgi:tRNA-dihydrouridine synthase